MTILSSLPLPTRDYWGNPVSGAAPNRGFYNGYGVALTSTLYFFPVVDTYTSEAAKGSSYGGVGILQVKGPVSGSSFARKTFLRFDLASVGSATAATLNLHGKNTQDISSALVTAYQVATDTWPESLTWNTSPQPTVGPVITSITVGGSGTNPIPYYSIPVTTFVQSTIASDDKASFLINSSVDKLVEFDSKESSTGGFPMLAVSGTITINPDQDTFVRDGTYGNSSSGGTSATLEVKDGRDADNSRKAYLRFPLPATLVGVNSATLRVYGNTSGGTTLVKIFRVTDSWTNGLTWNSIQPTTTTLVTAKLIGTTAQYYDFDITDWVQNSLGNASVSVLLMATDSSDVLATFQSQDSTTPNKPQLLLQ